MRVVIFHDVGISSVFQIIRGLMPPQASGIIRDWGLDYFAPVESKCHTGINDAVFEVFTSSFLEIRAT